MSSEFTVEVKEGFFIKSWGFESLDQAMSMTEGQRGRVSVLQGGKVVWENEEAFAWRHTKTLRCHDFYNGDEIKTIVEVLYKNEASYLWDEFYAEYLKLRGAGFREGVELSIEVPGEVGQHLQVGVSVMDGKISLEDYINRTTPYQMKYVRRKTPDEAIGNGRTAGSLWQFEPKENREETKDDRGDGSD